MSHEIAETDANRQEIARLTAALARAERWARLWRRKAVIERTVRKCHQRRYTHAMRSLGRCQGRLLEARSRIERAAAHLPGRPDVAESVLSEEKHHAK